MSRIWLWAAVIYAVIAVVTFGHSAAASTRDHAACEAKQDKEGRPWCGLNNAPLFGVSSAVLWPLYWSWEAWS